MTVYGYIRVSTNKQQDSSETQKMEVIQYCKKNNIAHDDIQFFEDVCKSGKIVWKKRKIYDIYQICKKGDILVCTEVSRLGRSMTDIISCINEFKQCGINIYFTKTDSLKINGENEMMTNIILSSLSLASELERTLISERTKRALEYKKSLGVKLGNPKKSKLNKHEAEIRQMIADGYQRQAIAKKFNITPTNFSIWLKKHDLQKKPKNNLKLKMIE